MIDSHAHVSFSQYEADRADVIARAGAAGVQWIEVGTDLERSRSAVALAEQVAGVWAAVGVHPSDIHTMQAADWQQLEEMARQSKVVAIGEVGLDFYRGGTAAEQLPALEQFVELAHRVGLPVIFHVRDGEANAHEALLQYLEALPAGRRPRGVIHTFSGTASQAQRYLALDMYLSFSGVVTFKNAPDMQHVAAQAPLERILIETDSPFLAPDPYRGKRNEPAYVRLVAEKVAVLRGVSVTEIDRQTSENARRLFALTE